MEVYNGSKLNEILTQKFNTYQSVGESFENLYFL